MPKIVNARVIVTCPGRNFVTLKIECDDGTTGVGDATLNGRELSVASYLTDHVVPCRHRRGTCRRLRVQARLPAREPAGRRYDVQLVSAGS